jgi:hypothetical protein
MKKIYGCKYTFKIGYTKRNLFVKGKGFFKLKEYQQTCVWRDDEYVFAENEEKAAEIFKGFIFWESDIVSPYSYWQDYLYNYYIIDKKLECREAKCTFDVLKDHMNSDMFLAYCRQELIDIKDVIA